MANRDRILKLLKDFSEWKVEFLGCIDIINNIDNNKTKNYLLHGVRAYFLDFHILCEDYISIMLKELNKYKIDISAIEGMKIIRDEGKVTEEFYEFYVISRRLRNRLAHRYKLPSDNELMINIVSNINLINEFDNVLKGML